MRSERNKVWHTKLTNHDNIEAHLNTVESIMVAYNVTRDIWVYKLAPQLVWESTASLGSNDP